MPGSINKYKVRYFFGKNRREAPFPLRGAGIRAFAASLRSNDNGSTPFGRRLHATHTESLP
ncbi:hypothetical protein J2TS6_06060 [Paenibacillus albilobatus]|uniref:Uncharacterized protein n=1 Tax=Paenibacillus albilobatus TaxID=2716884 RepID=A0A919XF62_9BACL|nr:hypothetical protein J2TS6_06060 [Paenibacillus albilobatus]